MLKSLMNLKRQLGYDSEDTSENTITGSTNVETAADVDINDMHYVDITREVELSNQLKERQEIKTFKTMLSKIYPDKSQAESVYAQVVEMEAGKLMLFNEEGIASFLVDLAKINELLDSKDITDVAKKTAVSQLMCFPSGFELQVAHLNSHRALLTLRAEKAQVLSQLQAVKNQLVVDFVNKFKQERLDSLQEGLDFSQEHEKILTNRLNQILGLPQIEINRFARRPAIVISQKLEEAFINDGIEACAPVFVANALHEEYMQRVEQKDDENKKWCACVASWAQIATDSSAAEARLKMIQAIANDMVPDPSNGWNAVTAYSSVFGRRTIVDKAKLCFRVEVNGAIQSISASDLARLDLKTFPREIAIPLFNFIILETKSFAELVEVIDKFITVEVLPNGNQRLPVMLYKTISARFNAMGTTLSSAESLEVVASAKSTKTIAILCELVQNPDVLCKVYYGLKSKPILTPELEQQILVNTILRAKNKTALLSFLSGFYKNNVIPHQVPEVNEHILECVKEVMSRKRAEDKSYKVNQPDEKQIAVLLEHDQSLMTINLIRAIASPYPDSPLERRLHLLEGIELHWTGRKRKLPFSPACLAFFDARELLELCVLHSSSIPEADKHLFDTKEQITMKLRLSEDLYQVILWVEGIPRSEEPCTEVADKLSKVAKWAPVPEIAALAVVEQAKIAADSLASADYFQESAVVAEILKLDNTFFSRYPKVDNRRMALYNAIHNGQLAFAKAIIDSGLNVTGVLELPDRPGWTLLYEACRESNLGMVRLLVDSGADIHAKLELRDRQDWTLLHDACRKGKLSLIHLLVESGADLNAKDSKSKRPYDYLPEHLTSMKDKMVEWAKAVGS